MRKPYSGKYIGITYPRIFANKLVYWYWKKWYCPKHCHLLDEVWSGDHYLICDACEFKVGIREMNKVPTRNEWMDAPFQIWVGPDGSIHYDSLFQKRWTGSWDRLMRCIENNIYSSSSINWPAVQDSYQALEEENE